MNIVLNIPDDVAARLGGDVERLALEGLALESYRAGRLAKPELRRMLGLGTLAELNAFLGAHDVRDSLEPNASPRRRMTVEEMLGFGGEITGMPVLDRRTPNEIMDDLSAA